MKCKCGNEQGKPLVKPSPVTFVDVKTRQEVSLVFNAGFAFYPDGTNRCWFCHTS